MLFLKDISFESGEYFSLFYQKIAIRILLKYSLGVFFLGGYRALISALVSVEFEFLERKRETERQRERQRETQMETETDRERETERE